MARIKCRFSATNLAILSEGDFFKVFAEAEPLRFLLISAKPLREPVARYGPFVMNSPEEIEKALMDLNNGTFIKYLVYLVDISILKDTIL